ncbi:damage-inducible protein DinB [Roseobacter cerasinus]|uniref:Damage-inducible protein DinB n=1 Tax=Roseobacter cerasinus TaxID=2602289 RepID=A0A640VNT9_9RHOB|nr:DinB family protein [Roseobacter cerasinus]GFE49709.1 damage-inducible protein DinB [Roseobacter cerasinus]
MIDIEYARTMSRYDRWQNQSLVAAADRMTQQDGWKDRGAFFGSIAGTLNHILWDHRVWLARQRGDSATASEIGARQPYTNAPREWSDYKRQRRALDEETGTWCDRLTAADVSRPVRWMRGNTPVVTEFGFNLVHMFNHATHHRGQVHAMLTAAGVDPGSTDLPMLPNDV